MLISTIDATQTFVINFNAYPVTEGPLTINVILSPVSQPYFMAITQLPRGPFQVSFIGTTVLPLIGTSVSLLLQIAVVQVATAQFRFDSIQPSNVLGIICDTSVPLLSAFSFSAVKDHVAGCL